MKTYGWCRNSSTHSNLRTGYKSDQRSVLWFLHPRERLCYSENRWSGGPQSWPESFWEKCMLLLETESRLSTDPASTLVTIRTELSQDRRIDYKENREPALTKINLICMNCVFGRKNCLRPRKIISRRRWDWQADSCPSPSHKTVRAQKLRFTWRWRINSWSSVMRRRVVPYTCTKCFAEACCLHLQDNTVNREGEEYGDFRYSPNQYTNGK